HTSTTPDTYLRLTVYSASLLLPSNIVLVARFMSTPVPATGGVVASKARRPLPTTPGDKIVEGERLRDEAQSLLKSDKPKTAAVKFRTVFAYTKGLIPQTSELALYAAATGQQTVIDQKQQVAVRALELSCNEGLATIYFRSGHHEKALGYSEKVLLAEPESAKALFRAGQLNLRLKNIEAAKRCLTRAAKHEPQNVNIRTELRNLTKLAQGEGVEAGTDSATTDERKESAGDERKCPKSSEEA
ncbi:unnamed protein product, partial [Ectocarpus sp. 12 AP-2014]